MRGNDTRLLYTTRARGVLVEPKPTLAAPLRLERPGDAVLEAGIGVGDGAGGWYTTRVAAHGAKLASWLTVFASRRASTSTSRSTA